LSLSWRSFIIFLKNRFQEVYFNFFFNLGSTIIIHYIMKKYSKKYDEVLKIVREKRPIVCPNEGFENILKKI
jgi:hypothetical protein